MAQNQLATVPPVASHASSLGLSNDELHQIRQFERIMRFRDAVISGAHTSIKIPTHLTKHIPPSAFSFSSKPTTPAKEPSGNAAIQVENSQSLANTQNASLPGLGNPPPTNANLPARPSYGSRNTEINPIFLEKSDDLIKAEIQLQRQRLERALRDEVEQRRASLKASAQSEPLPDFDLSDVLSKALTLVQATATFPVNAKLAANTTAASDSFDENSYYSSQHNSPDSSLRSSRAGHESDPVAQTGRQIASSQVLDGETQVQTRPSGLTSSLPGASATHQPQGQTTTVLPSHAPTVPSAPGIAHYDRYPSVGTTQRTERGDNTGSTSGGGSGDASRSEESNAINLDGSADVPPPAHQQLRDSLLDRQPSPLIQVRAQNLSPIAPQPAHVSPLAMARGPVVDAPDMSIPLGTTAQVRALRNEPNTVSSPDSSPQGGRNIEKRKGKKKKNNLGNKKAARQAPEAEPFIKPEPRSPSPMSAPSFVRPQKRQRRQEEEEPRYAQQERQYSRSYRDDGAIPAYQTQEYRRPVSQVARPAEYEYGREYVEDPRVASGAEYVRRVQSPGMYTVRTAPSEVYATSPASVDRYGREPTRYFRDGYEVNQMSARGRSRSPVMRDRGSPLMGPPKAPPSRVVVDPVSGRRYYDPAGRQSAAPPLRPAEPEILYERTPTRAQTRRPVPDPLDDDVIYQGTSPMYAASRRVVTQPEYAVSDPHRVYRQREYSTRPMAPPAGEEYVQVRGGAERRIVEEVPIEYMMRATTARPAETLRYELPREYGRVQSVIPEQLPIQDYRAPMHHEPRREVTQPGPRAYSVRPAAEPQVVRREYSVRPVEQQYYGQPVPARGEAEMSYIERPRVAAPEVYYANEVPRQVYR